jgi:hypothetical protein
MGDGRWEAGGGDGRSARSKRESWEETHGGSRNSLHELAKNATAAYAVR